MSDTKEIIKLKACPFCNGPAVIGRYQVLDEYFVECDRRNNCAVHPRTMNCASLKLAFERWNNIPREEALLAELASRNDLIERLEKKIPALNVDLAEASMHAYNGEVSRMKLEAELARLTAELAELRTVLKSKEIIIDNQEKRINELAERLLKK